VKFLRECTILKRNLDDRARFMTEISVWPPD